ncbi:TDP-N-acetylfucosamine:lipid II N-acetylfucosaminyltransferase [Escherichia coli]
MALLRQCDFGHFIFARQQGIGTLRLLIQAGISLRPNGKIRSWEGYDGTTFALPLTTDDLNEDIVREAQRQLASVETPSPSLARTICKAGSGRWRSPPGRLHESCCNSVACLLFRPLCTLFIATLTWFEFAVRRFTFMSSFHCCFCLPFSSASR